MPTVLRNDEAIGQHKTTAHYKGWADFKAAGGVEHQAVMRLENEARLFFLFEWCYLKEFVLVSIPSLFPRKSC